MRELPVSSCGDAIIVPHASLGGKDCAAVAMTRLCERLRKGRCDAETNGEGE